MMLDNTVVLYGTVTAASRIVAVIADWGKFNNKACMESSVDIMPLLSWNGHVMGHMSAVTVMMLTGIAILWIVESLPLHEY